MHFDIVEAVRQKQRRQLRSIRIENGQVVVRPEALNSEVSQGREPEKEIEPSEIVRLDD